MINKRFYIPNFSVIKKVLLLLFFTLQLWSQDTRSFKVFQFPANKIPMIDGNSEDWKLVPEAYTVGMNELWEDSGKHSKVNPKNIEVLAEKIMKGGQGNWGEIPMAAHPNISMEDASAMVEYILSMQ